MTFTKQRADSSAAGDGSPRHHCAKMLGKMIFKGRKVGFTHQFRASVHGHLARFLGPAWRQNVITGTYGTAELRGVLLLGSSEGEERGLESHDPFHGHSPSVLTSPC